MPSVSVEPRPKGGPQGTSIQDYVLEFASGQTLGPPFRHRPRLPPTPRTSGAIFCALACGASTRATPATGAPAESSFETGASTTPRAESTSSASTTERQNSVPSRAAGFHVPLKLTARDVSAGSVLLRFERSLVDAVVRLGTADSQDARGLRDLKAQSRQRSN
jgi:hypothetical protein